MTNDPKDRHVAAAAVRARADTATFNLRHFRPADLVAFGVRALHPDTFLMERYPAHADILAAIVREQAVQRTEPPLAPAAYLEKLVMSLPRVAAAIHAQVLPAR